MAMIPLSQAEADRVVAALKHSANCRPSGDLPILETRAALELAAFIERSSRFQHQPPKQEPLDRSEVG